MVNCCIAVSHVKKVYVDQNAHMQLDYILDGFTGLMVNIEVAQCLLELRKS